MPEPRHLRNAPIIEALIDFRVKARPGFRPEVFAELKTQLAARFPQMDERRVQQATIGLMQGEAQKPIVQDLGIQGYQFRTSDGRTIAQFRVDGFTLNRLRPYQNWGTLFPQAMELWRLYSNVAQPEVITRLAVRYINRIPLPSSDFTFETYLRASPVVPPELPQYIRSFLTRVVIHDPSTDITANVVQALQEDARGQHLAVLLDIDTYKVSEFTIDNPIIEQTFNQLRTFKNLVFFNSLTDETLREFE